MPRHLLLMPVIGSQPLLGREARPLAVLLFGSDFEAATGEFELEVGDDLSLLVAAFQPQAMRHSVAVHQLSLVSWPAPAGQRQFFTSCFRENPDTPDAAILAGGHARFEPYTDYLPPLADLYPRGASSLPALDEAAVSSFRMVFPKRLPLVKPGRFSTLFSLTLRLGEGAEAELQTFVHDPEMDVGGSYPPDPPDLPEPRPAPSKGKTAR